MISAATVVVAGSSGLYSKPVTTPPMPTSTHAWSPASSSGRSVVTIVQAAPASRCVAIASW